MSRNRPGIPSTEVDPPVNPYTNATRCRTVAAQMILTDLHRHLDGSLRLETLRGLAREAGVEVPDDIYFHAGMGLQDALTRFQITLSVLQTPGAVRRVASEMCTSTTTCAITPF